MPFNGTPQHSPKEEISSAETAPIDENELPLGDNITEAADLSGDTEKVGEELFLKKSLQRIDQAEKRFQADNQAYSEKYDSLWRLAKNIESKPLNDTSRQEAAALYTKLSQQLSQLWKSQINSTKSALRFAREIYNSPELAKDPAHRDKLIKRLQKMKTQLLVISKKDAEDKLIPYDAFEDLVEMLPGPPDSDDADSEEPMYNPYTLRKNFKLRAKCNRESVKFFKKADKAYQETLRELNFIIKALRSGELPLTSAEYVASRTFEPSGPAREDLKSDSAEYIASRIFEPSGSSEEFALSRSAEYIASRTFEPSRRKEPVALAGLSHEPSGPRRTTTSEEGELIAMADAEGQEDEKEDI